MKILLNNYRLKAKQALRIAGYHHRAAKDDYIRNEGNRGRFHAHILGPRVIDIHYDLVVDNKHWSPYMPLKHAEERRRFLRRIAFAQFRSLDPGEFTKTLSRY